MESNLNELLCRACLSDCSESYFHISDIAHESKTYKELIEIFSGKSVVQDGPLVVCEACAIQLIESYKFKLILDETQLILDHIKQNNEVVFEDFKTPKDEKPLDTRLLTDENDLIDQQTIKREIIHEVEDIIEEIDDLPSLGGSLHQQIPIYDLNNCVLEVIDKDISCMHCPKTFAKERGLFDHLHRYHRDKKIFECQFCHRFFYSMEMRDSHTEQCNSFKPKTEEMLTCPECGRTGEKKLIRNHMFNVHKKKHDGPFLCDICKIWLKSKECVSNHMKAVHLKRKFPCTFCDKVYSSRSGHDQHVQQYHTKSQTFNCQLCPYTSHSKTLLRKHEIRHTNTASFNCSKCSSKFVSLDNLRRHQFVHSDARPWICETCNRAFKCNITKPCCGYSTVL
uniref:CSON012916 protein n=1 Tax=Culicoides sonorensis TaxID=179676 RepID=A0A336KMI9_CULSO